MHQPGARITMLAGPDTRRTGAGICRENTDYLNVTVPNIPASRWPASSQARSAVSIV